jgi:hypothetical protein
MTASPPGHWPGQNPFDPQQRPVGSEVESLNAYFARQPYQGGSDNPLTNPAMFVRATPPAPVRRPSVLRRLAGRYASVIGAIVLLAACCGGVRLLGGGDDDDKPKRSAAGTRAPLPSTTSPSATRTYSPPPYSPPPPATTAPSKPSLDSVQKGQCLKNNGTNEDPEMVPAPCGKGTYQVLARFSGYIDTVCLSVQGYTTSYTVTYYVNGIPDSARSYVLCLKKR